MPACLVRVTGQPERYWQWSCWKGIASFGRWPVDHPDAPPFDPVESLTVFCIPDGRIL